MSNCVICQGFLGVVEVSRKGDIHIGSNDISNYPCATKCGHVFHIKCLLSWLRRDGSKHACPICKSPVLMPQVRKIFIDWKKDKRIKELEESIQPKYKKLVKPPQVLFNDLNQAQSELRINKCKLNATLMSIREVENKISTNKEKKKLEEEKEKYLNDEFVEINMKNCRIEEVIKEYKNMVEGIDFSAIGFDPFEPEVVKPKDGLEEALYWKSKVLKVFIEYCNLEAALKEEFKEHRKTKALFDLYKRMLRLPNDFQGHYLDYLNQSPDAVESLTSAFGNLSFIDHKNLENTSKKGKNSDYLNISLNWGSGNEIRTLNDVD